MHVHRNSVEHAYGICATKGHLFMCHFMSSENNIKEDLRALLINYQILLVHFVSMLKLHVFTSILILIP
jgi:hypothetical protein